MRATRAIVLLAALASSAAAANDMSDIRSVRTLAAEAAEVVRLQAQHRVTDTYARTMKTAARGQLVQEARVGKAPQLRKIAGDAISALDRNDAQALTAIAQQLFRMEGPHGRAD